MSSSGFIEVEPHSLHKYNILREYLNVCRTFDQHYSNFVYVDTHGGSGKVSLKSEGGKLIEGSPLIAADWTPSFPCHIVEIDPETYQCLSESTSGCKNVHTYEGDCNKLITRILSEIPRGQKFVFFFVDPSSLVYRGPDGTVVDQLRAETVRAITEFPRSELLLNFPLESVLRCAGDYFNNPTDPRAIASAERVTTFMGSTTWQDLNTSKRNRRSFLELYLDKMLATHEFRGAMLIRSKAKNLPLYYLVYATHNQIAAKIMRDIMRKEGHFGIYFDLQGGGFPTIDETYPLERFIFENR